MSLERLVICTCGHSIDWHENRGCVGDRHGKRCACICSREGVMEMLLALERDAIRRQWTRDEAVNS